MLGMLTIPLPCCQNRSAPKIRLRITDCKFKEQNIKHKISIKNCTLLIEFRGKDTKKSTEYRVLSTEYQKIKNQVLTT